MTGRAADPVGFRRMLDQMEAHWARMNVPILQHLRPGLEEGEIDAICLDALGFRLPVELRTWFSWHDGVPVELANEIPDFIPGFFLMPLHYSLEVYAFERAFAFEQYKKGYIESPDEQFAWSWFPLYRVEGGRVIKIVDCDVDEGAAVCVGVVAKEETLRPDSEHMLADIVALWLRCFETGHYQWDPDNDEWEWEEEKPASIDPRYLNYH